MVGFSGQRFCALERFLATMSESGLGNALKRKAPDSRKCFKDIARECSVEEDGFIKCGINPAGNCAYRQRAVTYDSGNFIKHLRSEHSELARKLGLFRDDGPTPAKKRKVI